MITLRLTPPPPPSQVELAAEQQGGLTRPAIPTVVYGDAGALAADTDAGARKGSACLVKWLTARPCPPPNYATRGGAWSPR